MERPSRESPGIRVALLDCGTGEGHNSAAAALGEALDRRGVAWEEAKPLALDGKRLGPGVDRAYAWMIRSAPGLFNQIYKAGERLSCADRQSPVYRVLGRHCAPLGRWLRRGGFTHVICTHLFPMEMMTALRLSGQWELPCYGVLTDYTCIPFTEETRMDGYFIAHQDLVGEMVERGVPQGRIFPSGIPVREKFGKPQERTAARRALGLPSQGKLFLVMGGSAAAAANWRSSARGCWPFPERRRCASSPGATNGCGKSWAEPLPRTARFTSSPIQIKRRCTWPPPMF